MFGLLFLEFIHKHYLFKDVFKYILLPFTTQTFLNKFIINKFIILFVRTYINNPLCMKNIIKNWKKYYEN